MFEGLVSLFNNPDVELFGSTSSSQLYGQQGVVVGPAVVEVDDDRHVVEAAVSVVEAEAVVEIEAVVEVVEVVEVMAVAEEEDEEADEDDSYPLSTPPQRVDRQVVVLPPRPEPPRPPNSP